MGVLSITNVVTGLSGIYPQFIYINTNDNFATVTSPGYLNSAVSEGYIFDKKQMALVYTTEDPLLCTLDFSNGNTSLVPHVGTGDVDGPSSSTNNAIPRWNGTSGTILKDSNILIDDSDNMTGINLLQISGDLSCSGNGFFGSYVSMGEGNGVRLYNSANTNYIELRIGSRTLGSDFNYNWPTNFPPGPNYAMSSDISGNMLWIPVPELNSNWINQTSNVTMQPGRSYACNNASPTPIIFTIPSITSFGDEFEILGINNAPFKLVANSGQTIHSFSNSGTTITQVSPYQSVKIMCSVANTEFVVIPASAKLFMS